MKVRIYSEYKTQLTTSDNIYRYIHGGRGVVELEAPSGKSHKYAFTKPASPNAFPEDIIFVYAVHTEEQKGMKLFYVGMIENNKFRITRNSRFLWDNEITKGANYIVKMATNPELAESTPMKLYHLGVCCRCGRALTSERALETGIGRKCLKYLEDDMKWNLPSSSENLTD